MDFTFDMYFRQFWSDSRLAFNGSNFGIDKLVVGAEYIRLIWVPDTFFVNEKVATFHKATTENQFLRISQSKLAGTGEGQSTDFLWVFNLLLLLWWWYECMDYKDYY